MLMVVRIFDCQFEKMILCQTMYKFSLSYLTFLNYNYVDSNLYAKGSYPILDILLDLSCE